MPAVIRLTKHGIIRSYFAPNKISITYVQRTLGNTYFLVVRAFVILPNDIFDMCNPLRLL